MNSLQKVPFALENSLVHVDTCAPLAESFLADLFVLYFSLVRAFTRSVFKQKNVKEYSTKRNTIGKVIREVPGKTKQVELEITFTRGKAVRRCSVIVKSPFSARFF